MRAIGPSSSRSYTLLILALGLIANAAAQTAAGINPTSTPPPGPLIQEHAPNFSSWTIITEGKGPGSVNDENASSMPGKIGESGRKIIQVTKTGDIRLIRITADTGNVDVWCAKGWQVTTRPEWKQPLISNGENPDDGARSEYATLDFPGFQWIKLENYQGTVKFKGRDCLVFKDRIQTERVVGARAFYDPSAPSTPPPNPEKLKVQVIAYVDLETRFPVVLIAGNKTSSYVFGAPPSAPLDFPPEIKSALVNSIQKYRQLLTPPSKP